MNVVVLQGVLSSTPRHRQLGSGTQLVSWEVTTPVAGAKQSVPVVWFDPPRAVQGIGAGDEVVILGSVRRRFYRTGGGATVSATEVLARRAARTGRASDAAKVRAAALELLDPGG